MAELVQGTDAWFEARCGKVTASRLMDVTAQTKSGWGAGRKNYMAQLIAERLTGQVADSFSNMAMQWGTDTEPKARSTYEFINNVEIKLYGFVDHPTIKMSGASPDGGCPDNGGIEIKCPNTATHIEYLEAGAVPKKYIKQMDWQMACTGWDWIDFVSFDPRLPADYQILVVKHQRNDEAIKELELMVQEFLKELDEKLTNLTKRKGK